MEANFCQKCEINLVISQVILSRASQKMGHLVTLWHCNDITCTNQTSYLNGLQFILPVKDLARTINPLMSLKHKRGNTEATSHFTQGSYHIYVNGRKIWRRRRSLNSAAVFFPLNATEDIIHPPSHTASSQT